MCFALSVAGSCTLQEVEAFGKAAALDTHKALVHIFFAQRSTKKVKGVTDSGLKLRPIKRLAVLGGGLMGSGIATAALLAGLEVTLKEINEKFLEVSRQQPYRHNLISRIAVSCDGRGPDLRSCLQSPGKARVVAGSELYDVRPRRGRGYFVKAVQLCFISAGCIF